VKEVLCVRMLILSAHLYLQRVKLLMKPYRPEIEPIIKPSMQLLVQPCMPVWHTYMGFSIQDADVSKALNIDTRRTYLLYLGCMRQCSATHRLVLRHAGTGSCK